VLKKGKKQHRSLRHRRTTNKQSDGMCLERPEEVTLQDQPCRGRGEGSAGKRNDWGKEERTWDFPYCNGGTFGRNIWVGGVVSRLKEETMPSGEKGNLKNSIEKGVEKLKKRNPLAGRS